MFAVENTRNPVPQANYALTAGFVASVACIFLYAVFVQAGEEQCETVTEYGRKPLSECTKLLGSFPCYTNDYIPMSTGYMTSTDSNSCTIYEEMDYCEGFYSAELCVTTSVYAAVGASVAYVSLLLTVFGVAYKGIALASERRVARELEGNKVFVEPASEP